MFKSRWFAGLGIAVLALTLAACNSSTPAGGGANPTTVNVTTVGTVPWLAAQDGTGAWTTLSGSSFTVSNSAGKYGIAWVCNLGSGQNEVHVTQATTTDATGVTASCQASASTGSGSISGTITNIPSGGSAYIAIGGQRMGVTTSGTSATFTLSGIATGTQTIIAYGMQPSTNALASVYVFRNFTINSGSNSAITVNLADATYAVSSGLSVQSVSLTGAPASETSGVAAAYLSGAASGNILASSGTSLLTYPVIPASLAQASDKYEFVGEAYTSGYYTGSGGDDQQALFVSHTPGSTTGLSLPGVLPGGAGIGVSGGTATATWGSPTFSTNTGLTAFIASVTPSATTSPIWYVYVSSNWLGSASNYTFPDFTATSGWNANWNFPTGVTADAWVDAVHANLTLQQLLAAVQANNYPNGTSIEMTQRLAVNGTY